jgi:hypothetical protein
MVSLGTWALRVTKTHLSSEVHSGPDYSHWGGDRRYHPSWLVKSLLSFILPGLHAFAFPLCHPPPLILFPLSTGTASLPTRAPSSYHSRPSPHPLFSTNRLLPELHLQPSCCHCMVTPFLHLSLLNSSVSVLLLSPICSFFKNLLSLSSLSQILTWMLENQAGVG